MPAIPRHTGTLDRLLLLAIVIVSFLLMLRFLEFFPNGWDQAEYSWAIQSNYLPHSPYILFFLLGKLANLAIPNPAKALAVLSMVSGLLALLLYYQCHRGLMANTGGPSDRTSGTGNLAFLATLLLGVNYLFIRQASTQEIYVVLLAFALLTVVLLLSRSKHSAALGGLAFGCAISVHNAAVFLLPALLFLVWIQAENGPVSMARATLSFMLSAATAVAGLYLLLYLILYRPPDVDQFSYFISYLRGISAGPDYARFGDASYLYHSGSDLVWRLVNRNTPQLREPLATLPVGIAWYHLLLAVPGYILLAYRNWRAAVFLALWSGPYLCYEILLGRSPDYGVYIVFVLPALFTVLACLLAWVAGQFAPGGKRLINIRAVMTLALLGLLLIPTASQLYKNRKGLIEDALWHFTPPVLAAAAASSELPQDAVVIQHRYEWNVNLLPYYSGRQHVLRHGDNLRIFKNQGPFSPLNRGASEPLTTAKLRAILASGRPVYAFEAQPLKNAPPESLDPDIFRWSASVALNLAHAKKQLGLSDDLSKQLAGGHYTLYQAELLHQ